MEGEFLIIEIYPGHKETGKKHFFLTLAKINQV